MTSFFPQTEGSNTRRFNVVNEAWKYNIKWLHAAHLAKSEAPEAQRSQKISKKVSGLIFPNVYILVVRDEKKN